MADGNFHNSPLPRNDYVSGVRAGEARMKARILNILSTLVDDSTIHQLQEQLRKP